MSSEPGYGTPEEAALAGFPVGLARVVRIRTNPATWDCLRDGSDDEVEIELMTNEPPSGYLYFVHVVREEDRWFESVSHN